MRFTTRNIVFGGLFLCGSAFATAPNTPTIIEPAIDGQIISPADVHMEVAGFSDPDPGDTHACSDWEIFEVSSGTMVWAAECAAGFSAIHIHLADGMFTNSYAGRTTLKYDTDYSLRVREKDSTGTYSAYATRLFRAGSQAQIFPLNIADIALSPAPVWVNGSSQNVILSAGAPAPSLQLQSAAGDLLLKFSGANGTTNLITNPGTLPQHVNVRVKID